MGKSESFGWTQIERLPIEKAHKPEVEAKITTLRGRTIAYLIFRNSAAEWLDRDRASVWISDQYQGAVKITKQRGSLFAVASHRGVARIMLGPIAQWPNDKRTVPGTYEIMDDAMIIKFGPELLQRRRAQPMARAPDLIEADPFA